MEENNIMRKSILYIMLVVLLFSMPTCFSVYSAQSDDASDFVLLSEVIPDAILEVRYYSTYNFVGDRIEGYEEPLALLTREAAVALREVSDELMEKGYRLKIYDAYRPAAAVKQFILWGIEDQDTRMKPFFYPDLQKQELFKKGYIARRSSHSRGSTIDLTLLDMKTGKELDMGSPFDFFGEISHPDFRGITEEQYENRMILQKVMTPSRISRSMEVEQVPWHL
jgi:D-alanyl-D-alanine dipeptidase